MSDPIEIELKALLAAPERPADDGFALRMQRLVLAEESLRRSRRAAWVRFATEMAAAAAAIIAFMLLARTGGAGDSGRIVPLFSPGSAGLLLLGLWVAVSVAPGKARFGN
jgi:hypothetical protein